MSKWPRGARSRTESTSTPDPTSLSPQPTADDAWKTLSLINDWIKHVETKTGVTLAAAGVTGTALFNLVKDQRQLPACLYVAPALCGLFVFASGLFAATALWPRLRSREDPTSVLYFHHIARKHKEASAPYVEALRALVANREELVGEIAGQIWANAHVARQKYKWSGLAQMALLAAVGTLGITAASLVATYFI